MRTITGTLADGIKMAIGLKQLHALYIVDFVQVDETCSSVCVCVCVQYFVLQTASIILCASS